MKKFELTNEFVTNMFGTKLFRIRALVEFGDVEAGELGGYVEKESNLGHGCTAMRGRTEMHRFPAMRGCTTMRGCTEMHGFPAMRWCAAMRGCAAMRTMHTLTVSDLSTVQRPSSVSKMAAWVCGAAASTGRLHSSGIRSGRHTEKQRRHKNT